MESLLYISKGYNVTSVAGIYSFMRSNSMFLVKGFSSETY